MDMKTQNKNPQIRIISSISILCYLLFLVNCRGYHYYAKKLVNKYECIESIEEIIGWEGNSSEISPPSSFDIRMSYDRRLFLSYIEFNEKIKSKYYPHYLELIGGFAIEGRIPIEWIEKKTCLKLATVEDVIAHYDTIYGFIATMPKLSEINDQLSENNKYYIDKYGEGYVGRDYWEEVNSFLLVEMDKYPEYYKIRKISETIPWETRIIYRRL
jgi:hypothetical protein